VASQPLVQLELAGQLWASVADLSGVAEYTAAQTLTEMWPGGAACTAVGGPDLPCGCRAVRCMDMVDVEDPRVDVCLYCLPPHRLRQNDVR